MLEDSKLESIGAPDLTGCFSVPTRSLDSRKGSNFMIPDCLVSCDIVDGWIPVDLDSTSDGCGLGKISGS